MTMLKQFIRTIWQSKYGMLDSLLKNKQHIRTLCANAGEECTSIHDKDLTDLQWDLLEV
jgi:hypothetical protein